MLSPLMTVFVLAVLWLIVVVPMLVRRGDERRRDRSVAGFGRSMRALGRRPALADSRPEVFVPHARRATAAAVAEPARRPVPAAQEALMYPVDRSEMSAARVQMMRRRRRSLGTLGAGTALFVALAVLVGGIMWLGAVAFAAGLVGYLYFLRSQALRDRERRMTRLERASLRRADGYDATELAASDELSDAGQYVRGPETIVRIDDDDIELQSMDTMDLTGLYVEAEAAGETVTERRAS